MTRGSAESTEIHQNWWQQPVHCYTHSSKLNPHIWFRQLLDSGDIHALRRFTKREPSFIRPTTLLRRNILTTFTGPANCTHNCKECLYWNNSSALVTWAENVQFAPDIFKPFLNMCTHMATISPSRKGSQVVYGTHCIIPEVQSKWNMEFTFTGGSKPTIAAYLAPTFFRQTAIWRDNHIMRRVRCDVYDYAS